MEDLLAEFKKASSRRDIPALLKSRFDGLRGDEMTLLGARVVATSDLTGREEVAQAVLGGWLGGPYLHKVAVFLISRLAEDDVLRFAASTVSLTGEITAPAHEKLSTYFLSAGNEVRLTDRPAANDHAAFMLARYVSTARGSGASRRSLKDFEVDLWRAGSPSLSALQSHLNKRSTGQDTMSRLLTYLDGGPHLAGTFSVLLEEWIEGRSDEEVAAFQSNPLFQKSFAML